jgi:hypothetical protein
MNSLAYIAHKSRNHYLLRFTEEYFENKQKVDMENRQLSGLEEKWSIITDCELDESLGDINAINDIQDIVGQTAKLFRQDMAILKGSMVMEDSMCWPIVYSTDEEYIKEDFPLFPVYTDIINDTKIEINPFPWFLCEIALYPNADSVSGLIDMWFQKWYYPRKKSPGPFLNVIHIINGPYKEKPGCELYSIDLGTAPAEAFCELINLLSRNGVGRIVIE